MNSNSELPGRSQCHVAVGSVQVFVGSDGQIRINDIGQEDFFSLLLHMGLLSIDLGQEGCGKVLSIHTHYGGLTYTFFRI